MLTNNFYTYMKVAGIGCKASFTKPSTPFQITDIENKKYYILNSSDDDNFIPDIFPYAMGYARVSLSYPNNICDNSPNYYSQCVMMGRDATKATAADYKLNDVITSGIAFTYTRNPVVEYSEELDEHFCGVRFSIAINCTSEEGMTIGEIGLIKYCSVSTYNHEVEHKSFVSKYVLLERTTFETPIVLEYQNTCVIDYTIMNKISLAKLGQ